MSTGVRTEFEHRRLREKRNVTISAGAGGGDREGARRGMRPERVDESLFHTMFPVHCYTPPEEYAVEGHGVFALPFGPRFAWNTVGGMPAAIGGRREPITKRP